MSIRPYQLEGARQIAEALGEGTDLATFELPPLDRHSAIDAVTKPLGRGSASFGEGVAAQLVDALLVESTGTVGEPDTSYVEPVLLQVVCADLWQRLRATEADGGDHRQRHGQGRRGCPGRLLHPDPGALTFDHELPTCEIGTWMRQTFVSLSGAARHARQTDPISSPKPSFVPSKTAISSSSA